MNAPGVALLLFCFFGRSFLGDDFLGDNGFRGNFPGAGDLQNPLFQPVGQAASFLLCLGSRKIQQILAERNAGLQLDELLLFGLGLFFHVRSHGENGGNSCVAV